MTTLEHAMLGATGVLATGLYRTSGWQLVAVAGLAAILPDWDGLTLLWSVPLFDIAHRAWGHGLLACLITSVILATADCRFDFMSRIARFFLRLTRIDLPVSMIQVRSQPNIRELLIWNGVVFLAILSHPFADMIVSGAQGLSDWEVKILYPFSNQGFVWPLVPWGDVGILLIFIIGMFAMLRHKTKIQLIACLVLLAIAIYALLRPAW